MGFFSWKDCKGKGRIIAGEYKSVYLLIPAEFGGGHYEDDYYNGYGEIGYHDVYEQVAMWNKNHISTGMIEKPVRETWDNTDEGQEYFEFVMKRYEKQCQRMTDFINGKDENYMIEKYGDDYLREIGIDISVTDKQNRKLKYPIKITHDENAVYEDCKYSKVDPLQGCY